MATALSLCRCPDTNQYLPLFATHRNEFILKYIETRNKLLERQEEVMQNIIDHARQEEEVKFKLKEAELTEIHFMTNMGIRSDSKLKVHIVDAQNLEEGSHHV